MQCPEVLSPAGDGERLQAALRYGADAVYLAMPQFGMRAAAPNFDETQLAAAVREAHAAGARVYVTCNILPRNRDLAQLPAYLEQIQDMGVDALIAADLGVIGLAERYAPKVALHISTQLGVVNYQTARELYDRGASRVVLARELSLEEIAEIRQKTNPALQLECFVHGAMCVSYSGRCLLSQYLTGRDPNHGECAQPCRWKYAVVPVGREGAPMPIDETDEGTFLFNAYDLNMIRHIPQLAAAGVSSLKIEGRAKAAYYAAVTTNAYRMAVDGWKQSGFAPDYQPEDWVVQELETVSHRPYGTGFYFGAPEQNRAFGGYVRPYQVAAVAVLWENGQLTLSQRNRFVRGEELEVVRPGRPPIPLTVTELTDEDGQPIEAAPHPTMICRVPCDFPVEPGDLLRRRTAEN